MRRAVKEGFDDFSAHDRAALRVASRSKVAVALGEP